MLGQLDSYERIQNCIHFKASYQPKRCLGFASSVQHEDIVFTRYCPVRAERHHCVATGAIQQGG